MKKRKFSLKQIGRASCRESGSITAAEEKAYNVIKDGGVQIYELNDEERAVFMKATEPVRDAFVKETGEVGKKLMEIVASLD